MNNITPSPFTPPCSDDSTPSPIRPEWVPLDEIAETWADFSVFAHHAQALQAVGNAFLALSFEMSAHTHYNQAYHGLWKLSSAMVAQGIAEAITDLRETCQQWVSAYQWLERFANEDRHDEERLSAIRDLFGTISAQQNRVRLLLARLQEEQRRVQRNGALMVHLGHLSSSLATGEKEEG